MEDSGLRLVYMTPDEIAAQEEIGNSVTLIPDDFRRHLSINFYGGNSSGTSAAGHVPNVIMYRS